MEPLLDQEKKLIKVGNYRILQKINEGSSSVVYLADFQNKEFALKVFKKSNEASLVSFRRESSTLARLNHPNLVKIYDVEEFEGSRILVMEYLRGCNLEQTVDSGAKMSAAESVEIAKNVALALAELHKNNLVHRDIKPANIFILNDGSVRLIDLGLVGDIQQIKFETSLVGTPTYSSPEQARMLRKDVDSRSDLYSLGASLFFMLTGRSPFIGTMAEVLQFSASLKAPDVRDFAPEVQPVLAAIVDKLLYKDPEDRYQSTQGLIYDLDHLSEIEKNLSLGLGFQLGKSDQRKSGNKTKFIDRGIEVQKLKDVFEYALKKHSGLVLVVGPSGSGKTRLCSEFAESLKSKNIVLFNAKCQREQSGLPLGPIRSAIDSFLEAIDSLSIEVKQNEFLKIRLVAQGKEAELIRLCPRFEKVLKYESAEKAVYQDVEEQGENFFNQIANFVIGLSCRYSSLIFQLDDIQWLDQGSAQVFHKILTNVGSKNILFLVTARSDQENLLKMQSIETEFSEFIHAKVNVEPFSKNQMGNLLSDFLGNREIKPEIIDSLHQFSNGNVFVSIEYLRAGIEQGFLFFKSNEWHLNRAALEKIALSDDVYQLIINRFEKNSQKSKEFLQAAALIGNIFKPYEIAKAVFSDIEEIDDILRSFENLSFIEKVSEIRWKFTHDKISESVVNSLAESQVRIFSSKLASFYFSKVEKTPDELFMIPRLFGSSDLHLNKRNALLSNIEAGSFALSIFSYNESYAFYKIAYELLGDGQFDTQKKKEIVRAVATVATIMRDEKLAVEAVNFHISSQTKEDDLGSAYGLKTWVLANLSDFVGACENFKIALKLLGKPYPEYLHWKLLSFLWTWTLITVWEFIPFKISSKILFKIKKISLAEIFEMFKIAQSCYVNRRSTLDVALLSVKLQLWGQLLAGDREKAAGYASIGHLYSSFNLSKLTQYYFKRAAYFSELAKDPATEAYVQCRRLTAFYFAGVSKNYLQEYYEKFEFFNKYLTPLESGRLRAQVAILQGFSGQHEKTIQLLKTSIEGFHKKTLRLSKAQYLMQQGNLHAQLVISGRTKEAQKMKRLLLYENFRQRYNPQSYNTAALAEITIQRSSEELDRSTDEMISALSKNSGIGPKDPVTNNYLVNPTYIKLVQFTRARNEDEKFSTRRALTRLIRQHALNLHIPLFRSNYYSVLGSYCRSVGYFARAEKYFNKAEAQAVISDNLIALFDVQKNRARIQIQHERIDLAKYYILSALDIAQRNKWEVRKNLLIDEFGHLLKKAELDLNIEPSRLDKSFTIQNSLQSHKSKNLVSSQNQNRSTIIGTSTTSNTIMGTTLYGDGAVAIEEVRFIDAILNVSSAFAQSTDPILQCKAILNELIKLFAAERGLLFELNTKTQSLIPLSVLNSSGESLSFGNNYSRVLVEKVYKEQRPIVISSTEQAVSLGCDMAELQRLRSMMIAPLILKEKVMGVICLDSTLTRGLFHETDVKLFKTLANHISIAIELSRMKEVEAEKTKFKLELDIQSAISNESKKVNILVDSMQQGLFSVTSDGTIVEPVSKFTKNLLGKNVVGKNFIEIIYQQSNVTKEKLDAINSAMVTVFGEDQLQWELMESNFPTKVTYNSPEKLETSSLRKNKILQIKTSPVWDNDSNLEKILFVVDDVTALEALENQLRQHQQQSSLLGEILNEKQEDLQIFFDENKMAINEWSATLQRSDTFSKSIILRSMHSLKGVARLYRLTNLSEQIHNSETVLAALNWREGQQEIKIASDEIKKIAEILAEYVAVFNKVYSSKRAEVGVASINSNAVLELEKSIADIATAVPVSQVENLRRAARRLQFKSLSSSAKKYDSMVKDISMQLNKKIQLIVEGEALVSNEQLKSLNECFIHLIRNSIDHGIEEAEERIKIGKSEVGSVRICFHESTTSTTITISDDGRGIDGKNLSKIAVIKGIISENEASSLSEQEALNLVFRAGLSSKNKATDVSGRGIGMDVVKTNIELLGGKIILTTSPGQGSSFIIKFGDSEQSSVVMAV